MTMRSGISTPGRTRLGRPGMALWQLARCHVCVLMLAVAGFFGAPLARASQATSGQPASGQPAAGQLPSGAASALPGTPASGATAASDANAKSLLDYINDAGLIGYVIILLSLVGLALVIASFIRIRRERFVPPEVSTNLHALASDNNIDGMVAYCDAPEADSYLARVVGPALRRCSRSPFGLLELRSAMEETAAIEVDRLHRTTDGIGVIAAVAPMLGLLGTVIGLIGAFHVVGVSETTARSQELASFMSLALVTTAQGLIVAIPCTAAHALFRRRIDRFASEAGDTLESVLAAVQLASGAVASARPAPARAPVAPSGNPVAYSVAGPGPASSPSPAAAGPGSLTNARPLGARAS
ncbi:MAG: MotA/TolQ/ExbB proton channel family protein [Planctomycetota bacterium]|nr:MotA/TolQ/ExbB proton channel family protein [Planctomycetota bacterium]